MELRLQPPERCRVLVMGSLSAPHPNPRVTGPPGPNGAGPNCSSDPSAQRARSTGLRHLGLLQMCLVCAHRLSPCPHPSFGNRSHRLWHPALSQLRLHLVPCSLCMADAPRLALGSQLPRQVCAPPSALWAFVTPPSPCPSPSRVPDTIRQSSSLHPRFAPGFTRMVPRCKS